jgi:aminopeptidase N
MQPGAASFADLRATAVRRVVLKGAELDPKASWQDGVLRLPGLAAENMLTVDADFGYVNAGGGLFRRSWPDGGVCVFSKPLPDGARHIFCCFHQEDLRAPITLSVSAPADWSCFANGPAVSERSGTGQTTWAFAPTAPIAPIAPIAPYLLSCCAGPFASLTYTSERGGESLLPLAVHARPAIAGLLTDLVRLDLIEQPLRYYERAFRTAYPYGKCDIVFVPDYPPLAFGAPGLVIVQERVLNQAADDKSGLFLPILLAHELAHSWLGGLVDTRAHEADGLVEGLTTYMSRSFLTEAHPLARPWDPEVSQALPDDGYAWYALPFLQLERSIGKHAVLDGLSMLIHERQNQCITRTDLAGCLTRATGHTVHFTDLEPG